MADTLRGAARLLGHVMLLPFYVITYVLIGLAEWWDDLEYMRRHGI